MANVQQPEETARIPKNPDVEYRPGPRGGWVAFSKATNAPCADLTPEECAPGFRSHRAPKAEEAPGQGG